MGKGAGDKRLSSINWEGKKEHKGFKRGFHFFHMPYCVNICVSLMKVFRRGQATSCWSPAVPVDICCPKALTNLFKGASPLLARSTQTTVLTEIQW